MLLLRSLLGLCFIILTFCSSCHFSKKEELSQKTHTSFPNGTYKALIMSYDDGATQDTILLKILNQYGIKGTFNLNSGNLGTSTTWTDKQGITHPQNYIKATNLKALYEGHEIAAHTVSHPRLTRLEMLNALNEIARDRNALAQLIDTPIVSFAYPYGDYNHRVRGLVKKELFTNARTVNDTGDFGLPADLYAWHPTCHDSKAMGYVDEFLALDNSELAIFYVWGHSWEYGRHSEKREWAELEQFCQQVGNRKDIWYAGAGEMAAFLKKLP